MSSQAGAGTLGVGEGRWRRPGHMSSQAGAKGTGKEFIKVSSFVMV